MNSGLNLSSDTIEKSLNQLYRHLYPFFCLLVLPNIVLYLAGEYFGTVRPLVNIDYVLPGMVFLFGFKALGVVLLVTVVCIDIFSLVSQFFPFLLISDFLYFFSVVNEAPASYLNYIFYSLLLIAVNLVFFWRLRKQSSKHTAWVVIDLMVLGFMLQVFVLEGAGTEKLWRMKERVIGSQIVANVNSRNIGFVRNISKPSQPLERARYQGATDQWFERIAKREMPSKVILIVAESWGVSGESANLAVIKPLYDMQNRFEFFNTGELEFSGATVNGELRELCRKHSSSFNLSKSEHGFGGCLPNLLAEIGYETRAMHAAAGMMYNRYDWYPRAGFSDQVFFESRNWPNRCYSFPGACDLDLMQTIPSFFKSNERAFLYWLTLNTHAVYDERDIRRDELDCKSIGMGSNSQTCRNLTLHRQFFSGFADILKSDALSGAEVIVVGDHEPPIFNIEEKEENFVENRVPWVHFKLKS